MSLWTEEHSCTPERSCLFWPLRPCVDRHVFSERICSNRLQRRRRLLARAGRLRLSAERPSRHPSRRLELERRRAPCLERARGSRLLARRSVAGFLKRACGREALSRPLLLTPITGRPRIGRHENNSSFPKALTGTIGGSRAIALRWTAPTYGIHGTPEPANIGKTESHGCIRLTNWDAVDLAAMVRPGTVVKFEDEDSPVANVSGPVNERRD